MGFSVVVGVLMAQVAGGCTKDTDCKGERICEAGVCVSAPAPASSLLEPAPLPPPSRPPLVPPPPPGPPADAEAYPRVVRRDGQVCVQSIAPSGLVEESCRRESARARPLVSEGSMEPSRPDGYENQGAVPAAPTGRFVIDALFQGGLTVVSSTGLAVLPQLGGLLAVGGRFRSGVGLVGLANVNVSFQPGLSLVAATLAPGLRFGDRSHFLLALGPTFTLLTVPTVFGSATGLVGTLLAQGVFSLGSSFALSLQSGLSFSTGGVIFTLGAGFGFGAF